MTEPASHDFKIYLGETTYETFEVWDDEELTDPYDFTGHSVSSQARISYSSTVGINLNASISSNIVSLNLTPAQAQAGFSVPANNKSQKYYYDIEITKPDTTKWTLARGIIEVFPEVTKI